MIKNALSILLVLVTALVYGQDFTHVEPGNWWSGMHRSEVQVMFHAPGAGDMEILKSEIPISNVRKTENPNFLFVTLETKGLVAGSYTIEFKKSKRKTIQYSYELKSRDQGSQSRQGFDASDVIYLLMPDRFANGDPSNDSHPATVEKANRSKQGGRHGGDIQGIINNLDYLNELGVTALWTTPLLLDDDTTYSYHTYGQGDVYRVDPRYGTNALYKQLAEEMHQRDMKLIMDYVTNHWGISHWMMNDMPTYDWFHQFPGYAQSNYRMTTQYDPNTSDIDQKYCEEGWFVPTMPDLNQSNDLVLNYLIQNAIWWIESSGLDGLRVDTYSYNNKEGIATWTKAIMDEYPNFNIVGEVWLHDQAQISYWQKDSPIGAIQSYNTYCPSVMDFTLHDAVGTVFHEENPNWSDGMIKVYENFVNDFLYPNPKNLLVFLENHDTQRFNQIYSDFKDYQLGLTLIATVRGIPQIYYGTEVGMAGDKGKGDGAIRQDFPGGWKGDPNNAFTAEGRTDVQNEYFEFTKKVLNWRKTAEVIHSGKTTQYLPQNNVYVYFRYTDNETVMVVLNNSTEDQELDWSRFEESVGDYNVGMEVIEGYAVDLYAPLKVSAKQAMIIELK